MGNLYMEKLIIFFHLISCWFTPQTKMNASHNGTDGRESNVTIPNEWRERNKDLKSTITHAVKNKTVLLFFSLSLKSNKENDQPLKVYTSQVTDLQRKLNMDIWLAGHTLITHLFMSRLCVCLGLLSINGGPLTKELTVYQHLEQAGITIGQFDHAKGNNVLTFGTTNVFWKQWICLSHRISILDRGRGINGVRVKTLSLSREQSDQPAQGHEEVQEVTLAVCLCTLASCAPCLR